MKNIILLTLLLLVSLDASNTIDTSQKAITVTNAINLQKAQTLAIKLSKYDIYIYKTTTTKTPYFIVYAVNIQKKYLIQTLKDIRLHFTSAYLSSNKRIKTLSSNNFNQNIFIQKIQPQLKVIKPNTKKPVIKKHIVKKQIIKKRAIHKEILKPKISPPKQDKESWKYILRNLKKNKIKKPNKILQHAKREFYNKNYDKAIIFFIDFLNKNYSHIEANFLLGKSYYLSKQYKLALQTYQNILIIDNSLKNVHLAIEETKLAIN